MSEHGQEESQEPQTPPAAESKVAADTEYLILARDAHGWKEQEKVEARSSNAAVRTWLAGKEDPDGTYVAVPVRSWQPVTVKTETQTKLVFD